MPKIKMNIANISIWEIIQLIYQFECIVELSKQKDKWNFSDENLITISIFNHI